MVRSCVVPGCKSGYHGPPPLGISLHTFPKDPDRRSIWAQAIPRKDWTVTPNSAVCSLHFLEDDFVEESMDKNVTRIKKRRTENGEEFGVRLKHRRLKKDSFPCVFADIEKSHIEKSVASPSQRNGGSSPFSSSKPSERSSRRPNWIEQADYIGDFKGLDSFLNSGALPNDWILDWHRTHVDIFSVTRDDDSGLIKIDSGLTIDENMTYFLQKGDEKVSRTEVKHVITGNKVSLKSQILKVLAYLQSRHKRPPDSSGLTVEALGEAADGEKKNGSEFQASTSLMSSKQ